LRIALNAQLLSFSDDYRSGGISRVIYHTLVELGRAARGSTYEVFVPELPVESNGWGALNFHATGRRTQTPAMRILWEQTLFARELRRLKPDLVHGMAYSVPAAWAGPSVVTVYDLSFLLFPKAFKPANRIYLAATTRATARRARRVLTISEHARRDIVRLLSVPKEYVDVTYPAVEDRYRSLPDDQVRAFRLARGLPQAFVFALGTLEPRKNLVGLLHAYARLSKPRPPLFVAGGAGWRFSPIFDTVRQLHLSEEVHFLGFVPEDELPLWYNAARLFVFPSLYEGFGLPVLEAMACGTPVITSTAASLPEVAGKAAVLVQPADTDRIAQEMQRVLDDPQVRMEMHAAGRIQASRFTWHGMTEQTVASYTRAVSQRVGGA
jgi:glycosyltransferase involved in cell wall biosynthesis